MPVRPEAGERGLMKKHPIDEFVLINGLQPRAGERDQLPIQPLKPAEEFIAFSAIVSSFHGFLGSERRHLRSPLRLCRPWPDSGSIG
jgi:hypothetical protein